MSESDERTYNWALTEDSDIIASWVVEQKHRIKKLQEQVESLEQQLKTAKADCLREFIPTIKAMDEPAYLKGRFQAELFWRGAFAAQKLAEEYANNLEGK